MNEKSELKWNAFETCTTETFRNLVVDAHFTDVTLVSDDERQIDAHKIILSSVSSFFQKVLISNPHRKPLIFLKGIQYEKIIALLEFIYTGQTEVRQEEVSDFVTLANHLGIKGVDAKSLDSEGNYGQIHNETKTDISLLEQNSTFQTESSSALQNHEDIVDIESISLDSKANSSKHKFHSYKEEISELQTSFYRRGGSFECDIESCDKSFTRSGALQRHKKIAHGGLRYPCSNCDYKATTNDSLKKHILVRHG